MIEINSSKALMAWLINFMAEKFGNSAILKGGMELQILDCPRQTNDIDYVFIPYTSKKDIQPLIVEALSGVPGMEVQSSMNSKCLRCICEFNSFKVQLEINAARSCESQELSTASFCRANNQQGRIIRGMRFDIALAHKIAAWNERSLMRDLYDCSFMVHTLEIKPDLYTLEQRLSQSNIRVGRKTRKASITLSDLVSKLHAALTKLDQSVVEEQMRDYLSPEELPGLEKKMRIGLIKLEEILLQAG